MIIDFHAHFHGVPADPEKVARQARIHGVDKLCVSDVSSYIPGLDEVRQLNDLIYQGCEIAPELFIPFTYVNPMHGAEAVKLLDQDLGRGMRGIKLWVSVWADDPCLDLIARWAIDHNMPVMHHSWIKWNGNIPSESQAHQMARLGRKFPELKLVMAHVGGDWEFGVNAVRDCPSICIDTSGSFGDAGVTEYCVRELGEDRVLFGSDAPGVDMAFTIAKIQGANISQSAKDKILGGNADRILQSN